MMSFKDISLEEEKGVDVGRVERDGDGREGGVESYCHNLNYASLHFMVTVSMAHMKVKGSNTRERMEKWRKILVIAEGKISLSLDAES